MKVILQQDVARLGKKHQEVEVPNGYAQNRLIPHGIAVPADRSQRTKIAHKQAHITEQNETLHNRLQLARSAFAAEPLQITMEVNEQGHLFQALNASAVVEAAAAQGVELTADMVTLPAEPIKTSGEHSITLTAAGETVTLPIAIKAK